MVLKTPYLTLWGKKCTKVLNSTKTKPQQIQIIVCIFVSCLQIARELSVLRRVPRICSFDGKQQWTCTINAESESECVGVYFVCTQVIVVVPNCMPKINFEIYLFQFAIYDWKSWSLVRKPERLLIWTRFNHLKCLLLSFFSRIKNRIVTF